MQVTNEQVYFAWKPLQELMARRLPVRTAYQLAKLAQELQSHYTVVDQVRNQLVKKYGEPRPDNPRQLWVNPEGPNATQFQSELRDLFAQTIDIASKPVPLPEKVDGQDLSVEPSVLRALDPFISL